MIAHILTYDRGEVVDSEFVSEGPDRIQERIALDSNPEVTSEPGKSTFRSVS
jgi:hypothetical protein